MPESPGAPDGAATADAMADATSDAASDVAPVDASIDAGTDRDPTYAFAGTVRSSGWDHATAVLFDDVGNLYATGMFGANVTIGSTNLTNAGGTGSPSYDIFVVKYAVDGTVDWAVGMGGPTPQFSVTQDIPMALAMGPDSNPIVVGELEAPIVLGTTSLLPGAFVAVTSTPPRASPSSPATGSTWAQLR
jgi:hypothetical protein